MNTQYRRAGSRLPKPGWRFPTRHSTACIWTRSSASCHCTRSRQAGACPTRCSRSLAVAFSDLTVTARLARRDGTFDTSRARAGRAGVPILRRGVGWVVIVGGGRFWIGPQITTFFRQADLVQLPLGSADGEILAPFCSDLPRNSHRNEFRSTVGIAIAVGSIFDDFEPVLGQTGCANHLFGPARRSRSKSLEYQ